eukprot:TRINITY_DN16462_c0_g1_i1.p1 TRINITY_DN16462_c0_g1~~TRINITY_DN16462_c0_g1_i1.p1  ORF type:complete len:405 (-),score=95.81 TRINITY_DN16462_c0_g1_i1:188-1402(-)
MTSRARAHTVSNLNDIVGAENRDATLPGKQFVQPGPSLARAALGDVRNKTRNASVPSNQGLKPAAKPKPKRINAPNQKENEGVVERNVKLGKMELCEPEPKVEAVEKMDIVDELDPEIEDIDKDDIGNPQLAVEYVQDIYNYIRFLEKEQSVNHDYLAGQTTIKPAMRAVLVDWLVGVHLQFKLLPETLYTSVAILDRFLQLKIVEVKRNTLQLVGVAAMLIASKYEEIYAPEVKDFVYITDKAYTEKEILRMELAVLEALDFNLGRPLPIHFLRRASKAGGVEPATHTLAKYLLEVSLVEYSMVAEPPSRLAAAALALSIRLLDPDMTCMADVWSKTLEHYTKYSLSDLLPKIAQLASILQAAPTAKLNTVYLKYSNKKCSKIARIPALEGQLLKDLAAGNIK